MIKAVLFDLDDTLVNHDLAIRKAAGILFDSVMPSSEHERKVFIERWISLNREWYKQFYAQKVTFQESGRGKLRDAFSIYGYKFSVTDTDAMLSQYWECYVSQCRLFDDVSECFARLRDYKVEINFVIVGTIMAGYDGHRGWLYTVAVNPQYRRRGIGTKLVQHAEKALTAMGCLKINLQVRANNAEVVEFYQKLGYLTDGNISMGKVVRGV